MIYCIFQSSDQGNLVFEKDKSIKGGHGYLGHHNPLQRGLEKKSCRDMRNLNWDKSNKKSLESCSKKKKEVIKTLRRKFEGEDRFQADAY